MATPAGQTKPNPEFIFETLNAYHRTAALKAGIELDVFTAIGEGARTADALAKRCKADARAMRILCDYLVIMGFLSKQDGQYALTSDSSLFLDRRSPSCFASAVGFLTHPDLMAMYQDLTAVVRKGGRVKEGDGMADPDNPIWIEFARSMAPLQAFPAQSVAEILNAQAGEKWKVLDIAAGHGMYGVTIAKLNPNAEIYALDWPRVLEVAKENARKAGVEKRLHTLPGNAFEVDFGTGYDIVLITGFLHHFDPPTNEKFLRKVHAALTPNGRAVTVEFIPNEDRVTPPVVGAFSMVMLGSTHAGDAYPFSEYERMFRNAGFHSNEHASLPAGPQSVIISRK